ncbi:MAG: DUF4070 domain-containing protein [Desulfovibrio sp.]|nr:MAG: DUF4070 domain-containing protein [Desulfovibrio sp.]
MNILLAYPQYPDTFWSFRSVLKYLGKKAAFPPLGLLTVGAMLPKGWSVRLVDVNVTPLSDEDIEWADMVFISAMIVQKISAAEIAARCQALGKTVVAGGPLFNTMDGKFDNVDHFVLDEAEITLPLFLADLEQGNAKHIYRSKERPDVKTTPIPAWHLLDMKKYATMSVQYSRGCPFNCEFCDIVIMNGRIPRTKSPDQILAEMEALHDAGWRGGVFIVDDNFIGNTAEVKRMLPRLIDWQHGKRHPFTFLTEASTNLADDEELMKLMSAANFHKVFLGIETPEVDSLKECGKHQNASRDLSEAVRVIQSHGLQVMGGFIVGFDNDTESTFDAQVRFIQQVGIVTAMVGMLNALPQTRLWHRLRNEKRLLETANLSGENTDSCVNFEPRMGRSALIEGYRSLVSRLYSRRMYYERINTFLKNYKPTAKSRVTWPQIRALVRSTWRIGLLSPASPYYWRLMLKTLFTNFRALPVAVEMMICGEHFHRMRGRLRRSCRQALRAGGLEPPRTESL